MQLSPSLTDLPVPSVCTWGQGGVSSSGRFIGGGEGNRASFPHHPQDNVHRAPELACGQDSASWSGRADHPLGPCQGPLSRPTHSSCAFPLRAVQCSEVPSRMRPRSGAQRTHSLEKASTSRQVIKAEQRARRERVPWRGGEGGTRSGRGAGGREAHGEAQVGATPSKHWPGSVPGYSRHEVSRYRCSGATGPGEPSGCETAGHSL